MIHDICLNIHYSAPDEIWNMIGEVYRSMDYWYGYENNGCPSWKGDNVDLCASVEPGGIQISGEMPDEIWNKWYDELKSKLSIKLGYEIGEPQEGYKFKYWTPFEKKYSDIETIDNEKIVFNDYSVFYFEDFNEYEKNISAERPYFVFKSPFIQLYIYFDTNIPKKKLRRIFNDFQSEFVSLF